MDRRESLKQHTQINKQPEGNETDPIPPAIHELEQILSLQEKQTNEIIILLFIITEKTRVKERKWDGVGVMKDKELKLEDVKAPHTLGWVSYIVLKFLYIDSAEEVVSLFEVELQKPRNLSPHESRIVSMGRVWVCMLLGYSQMYYSHTVS